MHHTVLEAQFGIQGTTVVEDDQNPLWEDTDDDPDDPVLQARRRLDDIENGEKEPRDLTEEDRTREARQVMAKGRKQLQMTEFHAVQNIWRPAVKSLAVKIEHLNLCGLKCWACVGLPLIHVSKVFMIVFMIVS